MAGISRQIGWSQESNLLYYILQQLTKLTSVIFNLKPKYKVFTALLNQSGGDVPSTCLGNGDIEKGFTYTIIANPDNNDLTIYGAPDNNVGTFFIANQDINLPYTSSLELLYNTGAPVATVLENTIGNVWFTYNNVGEYYVKSNALFTPNKTLAFGSSCNLNTEIYFYMNSANISDNEVFLQTGDPANANGYLINTPIEIRVYY